MRRRFWTFLIVFLIGLMWIPAPIGYFFQKNQAKEIGYSEFLKNISEKNFEQVILGEKLVSGILKTPEGNVKEFHAVRAEDPKLIERLESAAIPFRQTVEFSWGQVLSWLLPLLLILSFFTPAWGASRGFLSFGRAKAKISSEREIETRFHDIAGAEEAKSELMEIVEYLKDPTHLQKLGGRIPKGVLLAGPPGTGKTLLARAVAGEAHVPFLSINGSEFVEMFVGMGASRVRDLFEQARAIAPAIIFIDEIDSLGKSRSLGHGGISLNDEKEQTLNQLLAEMDGFDPTKGVVVLAATNRPEILDPALLRAGRFDRQVMVGLPDRKGRLEILRVHARKVRLADSVNLETVAQNTTGFSGADLANLVNEAAIRASRRRADQVEERDLHEAFERIVAGIEKKSQVLDGLERRRVAFHEMGHALVSLALGTGEAIHKVSIVPRGMGALGFTLRRPQDDKYLMTRSEIEARISVLLGGRAAEALFFDEVSTGAADDIDKATDLARSLVTRFGLSEKLGHVAYERIQGRFLADQPLAQSFRCSEQTAREIDLEVKGIIDRCYGQALRCLRQNKDLVHKGALKLLEKDSLEESDIRALWAESGRPYRGESAAAA